MQGFSGEKTDGCRPEKRGVNFFQGKGFPICLEKKSLAQKKTVGKRTIFESMARVGRGIQSMHLPPQLLLPATESVVHSNGKAV